MVLKHYFIFIVLLFPLCLISQNVTQTLRGKITDEVGFAITKASVYIENTQFKASTDEKGQFEIPVLPIGRYTLKISAVGFETVSLTEQLVEGGKHKIIDIRLKQQTIQLTEAVIRAEKSTAMSSVETITQEQTLRYAATFFDPARLATSYPAVSAANDQANGLVIRGYSPNGMQWRLEGVEIVNPNHLSNAGTISDRPTQTGGGTTVFSAQLLDKADFLTGAFPAEYGNAISGVMDVHLRKGNNQKHEFTGQAGLIGFDFAAEGPISKKNGSSYLVNYRYSFTGLLAAVGVRFGGEAIKFSDLAFNISLPTQKAGNFTFFGMFGKSSNDFEAEKDVNSWIFEKDSKNIFYKRDMNVRGITHAISIGKKSKITTTLAQSISEDNRDATQKNPSELAYNKLISLQYSTIKNSLSTHFSSKVSSNTHLKLGVYLTQQTDRVFDDMLSTNIINSEAKGNIIQPHISFEQKIGQKLVLNGGFHFLNYTYNKTNSVEPRLAFNYAISPTGSFILSYGRHSQLQLPAIYLVYGGDIGNWSNYYLGFTKSDQYVLSYLQGLSNDSKLKIEGYYRKLFNVPLNATFTTLNLFEYPANIIQLQNTGTGRNYGIEATYEKYLTKKYYYIVSGSIYKSLAKVSDGIERSTRFDGGHTFSFTGGKELIRKNNKRLGLNTRVLWLGGFRDTPIDVEISESTKATAYKTSLLNTIKLADYFRTDLRVYWKRNKPHYTRTCSLDIQNLTNTENEAYYYYDSRAKQVILQKQLGIIPVLNYKVEF